jgi:hypothetical protein
MSSGRCASWDSARTKKCATGTAELGSYPTDATREGRSRRAVRNLPLCQRPNVCISNRCGILARWYHYKSSVPNDNHIFRLGTVAVKS